MVTRLRSDKGSFVRSPLGAFDSEAVPDEYTGELSITGTGGNNIYWAFDPLLCSSTTQRITGAAGPGQRWNIVMRRIDDGLFDGSIALSAIFTQPGKPGQLSVPDVIAGTSNCRNNGQGGQSYYAGPTEPTDVPQYSIYDRDMILEDQFSSRFQQLFFAKHGGTSLPQAHLPAEWVNGVLNVTIV